jgi:RNA polymerase sigma-70 factor (ECF subfamily)
MVIQVADEASGGDRTTLGPELAQHRAELTGHCQRILGSATDAEDAAQETLVKAWRAFDRFEGRARTRTWIYRIATNVCLDILDSRRRHPPPIDIRSGSPAESSAAALSLATGRLESARCNGAWDTLDPAELAIRRDSIRLAFVVAFRRLPPRQRAVLILRDVLCWTSLDVAERLGTTVAAVNSALQRARATLATRDSAAVPRNRSTKVDRDELLLATYVDAFDRLNVDALVSLLHDDATAASSTLVSQPADRPSPPSET